MAITKPIVAGYPDLKVVKKNEQVNLSLSENFEHLYTDIFSLAQGETYFTEALHSTEDTALFLWADSTLLTNGKNKIKYTNNSAGPMQIQLVIKLFDETNENGKVMPAGNYSMFKGDTAFSDGETELPGLAIPDRLCVNSRIYAVENQGPGGIVETFDDQEFGKQVFVAGNKVVVSSREGMYVYTSEGIFVDYIKFDSDSIWYHTIDVSFDVEGNGLIALGLYRKEYSESGSGSGNSVNSGKVEIYDQDLQLLSSIDNPSSEKSHDYFGRALSITHEGMLVVVASGEDREAFVPNSGSGSGSGEMDMIYDSGVMYIYDVRNTSMISSPSEFELASLIEVKEEGTDGLMVEAFGFGESGKILVSHFGTPDLDD